MRNTIYPYPFLSVQSTDGTRAQVTRHKQNLYSLTIISRSSPRNRWGTWAEIVQDMETFKYSNALPIPIGERW